MLDIGWSEMGIIVLVALVVIGPKELPNALRTITQFMRQARRMAAEFQGGIDQIVREAELDDARRTIQSVASLDIKSEVSKMVDPTGEITRSLNEPAAELAKPPAAAPASQKPVLTAVSEPTSPEAQPPAPLAAEPETVMRTGAPAISDESSPEPTPPRPIAQPQPPGPVAIAPDSVMPASVAAIDDGTPSLKAV